MRRNIIFAIATGITVVALTAACSSDIPDNGATSGQETSLPIKLSFGNIATRSVQDSTFADGTQLAVFCDSSQHDQGGYRTIAAAPYFGAWVFTAQNGNMVTYDSHAYPHHNLHVDIYATNWPGGDANGDFFETGAAMPSSLTINTTTKQTTDAELQNADLLYGVKTAQAQTSATVNIKMYHMLSKLQFRIAPATGGFTQEELEGSTIKVLGVPKTYTFTLSKTDSTTFALQASRDATIGASSDTTSVEINNRILYNFQEGVVQDYWTEAIVPRKSFSMGDKFLSLTINNGIYKGMTLYYTLNTNLTLQGGKMYKFNISVQPDKLTGQFTLEPWETGPIDTFDDL